MRLLLLIFVILASACSAGTLYRSPGPYHGGSPLGKGTYLAELNAEPKAGEPFRFNATFQRQERSTLVAAVSPQGRPVFRVRDHHLEQPVPKFQLLPSELSPQGAFLEQLSIALRPLFRLEDRPSASQTLVKERYSDQRPSRLEERPGFSLRIDEFDWEGHVFRLTLEVPLGRAKVTLREYEVEKPTE